MSDRVYDELMAQKKWASKHYGCITTALANLANDWGAIANAEPKPGEEWLQTMAREQHQKYSEALAEFETLF